MVKSKRKKCTQKLGESQYSSWELDYFEGQKINPHVLSQGHKRACALCAFISGGQMELNRVWALDGETCKIRFILNSMYEEFVNLHGRPVSDEDYREKEHEILVNGIGWIYQPSDAAGWIFKNCGIRATCTDWGDNGNDEDGRQIFRRLAIEEYTYSLRLTEDEVKHYLDQGKPVLASLMADDTFHDLAKDDIYRWDAKKDANRKLILGVPHLVVLMGHGKFEVAEEDEDEDGEDEEAEEDEDGDGEDEDGEDEDEEDEEAEEDKGEKETFYPFLNSQSETFGDWGYGFVFHDELRHFYVLKIKKYPREVLEPPSPDLPRPLLLPKSLPSGHSSIGIAQNFPMALPDADAAQPLPPPHPTVRSPRVGPSIDLRVHGAQLLPTHIQPSPHPRADMTWRSPLLGHRLYPSPSQVGISRDGRRPAGASTQGQEHSDDSRYRGAQPLSTHLQPPPRPWRSPLQDGSSPAGATLGQEHPRRQDRRGGPRW